MILITNGAAEQNTTENDPLEAEVTAEAEASCLVITRDAKIGAQVITAAIVTGIIHTDVFNYLFASGLSLGPHLFNCF